MMLANTSGDPYWPADRQRIFSRPIELSSRALGWKGIRVDHYHSQPDSYASPALLSHMVTLHMGPSNTATRMTHMWNGRTIEETLYDGDCHIYPAGTHRRTHLHTPGEDIFLGLEGEFFSRTLSAMDVDASKVELQTQFQLRDPFIAQIGRLLLDEVRTGDDGASMLMAESLTSALIIHLVRRYSNHTTFQLTAGQQLPEDRFRRAIDFIHAYYQQPLTLQAIADTVHLSVYHFTRLFKQRLGITPHQYVLNARIEAAKNLLEQRPACSITQVAQEVGFVDHSHLTRHFKRIVGVSPVMYRNSKNIHTRLQ